MRVSTACLLAASLVTLGSCFQQIHARPNAYQILACQELLKGILARPETLKISRIELGTREKDIEDEGNVVIHFSALDKYAKEVESAAFCSAEDRASASIMNIRHEDHMKP